jgi:hypothetical protein
VMFSMSMTNGPTGRVELWFIVFRFQGSGFRGSA